MKRIIIAAAVAVAAAVQAELIVPQSGERVIIADREFVVISAGDWENLTNRIGKLETIAARRWTIQHSTESGRVEWHGKRVGAEVDAEARTQTAIYEDGYRHVEAMAPKRVATPAAVRRTPPPPRPKDVPVGAWSMRLKRIEAEQAKPAEVSATFGPGGKVIKVEGGAK